jgi:hypothetical protein
VKTLYVVFGHKESQRTRIASMLAQEIRQDRPAAEIPPIGYWKDAGRTVRDKVVGNGPKALMTFLQEVGDLAVIVTSIETDSGRERIPTDWLTVTELTGHTIVPITVHRQPTASPSDVEMRGGTRHQDEE